jgi:hypothetical protein
MKEYGGKGEDVSPEKFVIQSRGEISVNLPSFPAWIFLQEE